MLQTKKISFLITVLLVNFLIASCGCAKKKGDPLARAEKRLKNNLKEQCNPEGWKKLEEAFEQDRNSSEKMNQHIQRLLALQEKVNNLEKFLTPIGAKIMGGGNLTSKEKQELQPLLDFVSPLKVCPEDLANKKIDDLLKKDPSSLKKFSGLLDSAVLPMIKSFLTNQLELWRNLKQQLEQKSTETDNGSNES